MDQATQGHGGTGRATVLVIEDEAAIRELIANGLAYAGYQVLQADSGESGLRRFRTQRPDAVVLDVRLPGMDGFSVCRELRALSQDVVIVMVTARDGVSDRVVGLDQGADDYVVKPFALEELTARLRAHLRRRNRDESDVLTFEDVVLDRRSYRAERGGRPLSLSRTEFQLLAHFLEHPHRVFSKDALLNAVWGYDYVGDAGVVEVYVSYLRDKLGDRDRRLIQTVRGVGYRLGDG
ncbi:MAG: response regulator transcription factor [Firmicutes bacterium]|nr:response regulator transcription factor [Bacillota bacterium]